MAGELSGVTRNAWQHTVTNWRGLLQISLLPFGLNLIVMTIFIASMDLKVLFVPDAELGAGVRVMDFFVGLFTWFLFTWIEVRVLRFMLIGETASIVGTPGTLRCTGRKLLYMFLLFIFGILVVSVFGIVGGAILAVANSTVLSFLFITLIVVAWGWAGGRMLVGFVPIAVGERPGFFSGWQFTVNTHMALFGRLVAIAVILFVITFVAVLISILLFGDSIGAYLTDVRAGLRAPSLRLVLVFYLATQLIYLMSVWFFAAFFAEVYLRLSRRAVPLHPI